MNLVDLNCHFGTEQRCKELLKRLRWPEGVICPRCQSKTISRLFTEDKFECADCTYQFSVTAGTIFHDSHLPLTKWFLATLLMCEAKKGISACQIQRTVGIGGYKTAWYLCHRIRSAMSACDKPMLSGEVEMDETYVGGRSKGRGHVAKYDNKSIVIGIRQREGELRYFHAKDVKSGTLARYIKQNISQDAEMIITDDFMSHGPAVKRSGVDAPHGVINHSKHHYAVGKVHTNTIESAFSLLKRGLMGTWHKVSAKHLHSYLEEMTFRFNRRKHSDLFIDTLRHMITAPVLTFEKLTAERLTA